MRLTIIAGGVFLVGLLISTLVSQPPCANSFSCIKDLSGQKEVENEGTFLGQKVIAQDIQVNSTTVLGQSTSEGEKHIYVDLNTQQLTAYEGSQLIYTFPVSTGKWYPTPTGDFRVWIKLRYTRMSGGNKAWGTYYNLPNVPYTMYFYNDQYPKIRGFGLHGAYWHNNFGHPMSHGCVNMRIEDAGKLYYWTNPTVQGNLTFSTDSDPGTLITISGITPKE